MCVVDMKFNEHMYKSSVHMCIGKKRTSDMAEYNQERTKGKPIESTSTSKYREEEGESKEPNVKSHPYQEYKAIAVIKWLLDVTTFSFLSTIRRRLAKVQSCYYHTQNQTQSQHSKQQVVEPQILLTKVGSIVDRIDPKYVLRIDVG